MLIYATNQLDNNIYDKLKRGTDGIEIHLNKEFIEIENFWNEKLISITPIKVVHTPLFMGDDIYIENLYNKEIIEKTCNFANNIANVKGYNIIVVIHMGISYQKLISLKQLNQVQKFTNELLFNYPNIEIAIENISTLQANNEGEIKFKEISFLDAPLFVKSINNPRLGTCLDICHSFIDIRLIDNIKEYLGKEYIINMPEYKYGLKYIFEYYKDTAKLIHLSKTIEHGQGKFHGVVINSDDEFITDIFVKFYNAFNYKCPVTLEVSESNYSKANNYSITKKTLLKSINKYNNIQLI